MGTRMGRTPNGTRPLRLIGWTAVVALALYFVARNALHYYYGATAHENYQTFAGWIRLHIAAGMGALFAGLAQFRTGLRGGRWRLHRLVGRVYLGSIAVASLAAAMLLARTRGGWVFASGLAGLTTAWLTTAGLAYIAVQRGNIMQHREWMIRSYVVTFAFVNFRILNDVLGGLHVGRWQERAAVSSWFCWAVPLLVTELVLQGRKVFANPARPRPAGR
ncbi:MAG TPA: DUF2306 domain-containing protein [Gemmatimonadaceae bacterium]|nr:DUF2306 domain-containing protein [Gemmatimonadaceae bacterium]